MALTKVSFVELPIFAGVVPLASGYMQAMCLKDPLLAASYQFEKISLPVKTPYDEILSSLERSDADVYAFSCYVWNSRLVSRLATALQTVKPRAHVMLGGPQVMHQAAKYLSPERDRMWVCNGEGERTFANFLRVLQAPSHDFSGVKGLSFYRDGELVTTAPEPRIGDLSEIPSPFLEGLFEDGRYTWMLIETNRGCPFTCNYCFWGAATGAKVYRYDDARVEQELAWISQSNCMYLFIADANWGMLKRDVDLSRHIVTCQKRHGAPISVFFCASKNTPERVAEISRIFRDAGVMACQSVALQTMNPETLRRVERTNIKTSVYVEMQQLLNEQGTASYVELIWPLPGETLSSFQEGLARLCELGADALLVYPLLLINNVALTDKRTEFGLKTVPDPDPDSEAEIVIETSEVDRAAYEDGARFVYAVTALYTLRGLRAVARYLRAAGIMSYVELFRAFVAFWQRHPQHPWSVFCEQSIRSFDHVTFSNTGAVVHLVLHAHREAFDDFLRTFLAEQSFWHDTNVQVCFELDLLNRPYVYRNTPIVKKPAPFAHVRILNVERHGYVVEIPQSYAERLHEYVAVPPSRPVTTRFMVNHRQGQLPFMASKSLHENFMYCQDMRQRMRDILPSWQNVAS